MKSLIYIGMDVHSKTFSLCAYNPKTRIYSNRIEVENNMKLVKKYAYNLLSEAEDLDTELIFGYEAGCLGFTLADDIKKMGFECRVMAPSTIRIASTDRIRKTDRRDAKSLAEALANDAYSQVHIPDQEDREVQAYIRMREDVQDMVKQTKQRINAFLLKQGKQYDQGKSKWTICHRKWLKEVELTSLYREVLDEYLITLEELEIKVDRYDTRIVEISNQERYQEFVDKLSCFKGFTRPIAMRIVSEIGDFSRFQTAGQFASYLGLTPSEHSSSESENKGTITKMGNSHVRKTLIEAAQSMVRGIPGRKSKILKKRQEGNSSKVIHYADKGNMRIQSKFKRMMNSGKNRNTAITACAREMACFIWGMATGHIEERVDTPIPVINPETGEILVG